MAVTYNAEENCFIYSAWEEFRKLIDGTIASLSYNINQDGYYYFIITEQSNGACNSCQVRLGTSAGIDIEQNLLSISMQTPDNVEDTFKSKYDIQDDVIYIGKAKRGTIGNQPKWTINKIVLVNGLPVDKLKTRKFSAIWDNRDTEDYD